MIKEIAISQRKLHDSSFDPMHLDLMTQTYKSYQVTIRQILCLFDQKLQRKVAHSVFSDHSEVNDGA